MDKSKVRRIKERASYDLNELFSFLNKTLPIWSGVVPVETKFVTPEVDKDHSADIDLPDYLESL